jgi:hypothetical protein
MSNSGLSVSDEEVLETVVRMLNAVGEVEAATLIRRGRCRFEQTGYDNWNGGTYFYTLFIEIDAETYTVLHDRRETLEKQITEKLSETVEQLTSDWYSAKLVPLIVTLPGRPDLKGGAVSECTRKNIIDMMRRGKVAFNGALADSDFLTEIFDLTVLPSRDRRFTDMAGDVWQHRVRNDDWPDDWVYDDDRLNIVDLPDAKFLKFVERLVDPIVRPDHKEATILAQKLDSELHRDGWSLIETDASSGHGRFRAQPRNSAYARGIKSLRHTAAVLNSAGMHQQLTRIETAIDNGDPALAIGMAKELIETCCRHIADRLELTIVANADMPELVKATLKALQLVPETISEQAKGAQIIRRILSNLSQISQGLSELRNLYGIGHGRNSSYRGLNARHARLAVASAAAFVEFAVWTFQERLPDTDNRT